MKGVMKLPSDPLLTGKLLTVNGRAAADPVLTRCSGLVRGGMGLDGLVKGDGEAERFDLPHVVTELAVFVGAVLVVAVAEVGVPGGRAGQQVQVMTRMERATATWSLALPRRRAIRW